MIQLLLILITLVVIFSLVRGLVRTAGPDFSRKARRIGFLGLLGLLLVLAASGRLGWVLPLIGALFAAAIRLLPGILVFFPLLQRLWRQQAAQAPGATETHSTIETGMLRMRLDRATGEITGEVLAGRFAGRQLLHLTLPELQGLYAECLRCDTDSARLLATYLDRMHGDRWRARDRTGDAGARPKGGMSREEALDVLGLAPGATREAIIEAHRRLMQRVHPDRGGSDYLAAKINLAKDVLLRGG
ncbi:MAG TPA: molecular chaperone DnaJ [Methylococcus sp.]|nr:molecular chaperone DnaJ [Methylococcus sp.]